MNELKNGIYQLSGVDYCGEYIRIILDGVVYEFEEDSEDGYRSYMHGPRIVKKNVENTFPKVSVQLKQHSGVFDGISLWDTFTKKEVLTIGTNFYEEYYPIAVFHWHPEYLIINKDKGRKF